MSYDPSIQALIEETDMLLDKPIENRKLVSPYGIDPLDKALFGLDIPNGEFNTFQGEEKQRKTTTVENIVINTQVHADKYPGSYRPVGVVDMLESSMSPLKYVVTLRANLASRYLIANGHMPNASLPCPKCGNGPCKELALSYKQLQFKQMSTAQREAMNAAREDMLKWTLYIFGAQPDQGDTRNLESSVLGTKDQPSRWQRLVKEKGAKLFVCDHGQQYDVPGGDYEKMIQVVPAHAKMVASYAIVDLFIAQLSLSSIREASQGTGKYTAAGGRKAAQESNNIISVNYTSGSGKVAITLEDSRDAGQFSVWQPLEENSGAFYSSTEYPWLDKYAWAHVNRVNKLEFRPGMNSQHNGGSNGNAKGR